MPQAGALMVLLVQPMDLTGTIVGDGVQALEADMVMVQAQAGHLLGLGGVMDLVMGLGLAQVPGTVMAVEVVVLMVVVMGLEVDKAIPVAAALVEEAGLVTAGPQVTETTMVKWKVL